MAFLAPSFLDSIFKTDGFPTSTTADQTDVEAGVLKEFESFEDLADLEENVKLLRTKHRGYAMYCLTAPFASYMESLSASMPWLAFWSCRTLELTGGIPDHLVDKVAARVLSFESPTGGFGGGVGQVPHILTTFSSIHCLAMVKPEALLQVNRTALYRFLKSCKHECGGFMAHHNGEVDTRITFGALSTARIMNLLTEEITEGLSDWLVSCQNFDGGFGGEPFNESHGGYTYTALASLALVKSLHRIDLLAVTKWLVDRQYSFEGGFNGRPNKLVDVCYAYWQSASFPIIDRVLPQEHLPKEISCQNRSMEGSWLFNQHALQHYILVASQVPKGGFRDKPGTSRDPYHTCFGLSGLSIAQAARGSLEAADGDWTDVDSEGSNASAGSESTFIDAWWQGDGEYACQTTTFSEGRQTVTGIATNAVPATHPLHIISPTAVHDAMCLFEDVTAPDM